MRIRTGLLPADLLLRGPTACTAAAPKGPDATVTTPAVGRPPADLPRPRRRCRARRSPPTPALGISNNDGLAPGASQYALTEPCMSAAGYPGVTSATASSPSASPSADHGPGFHQPWGGWGYLGAADAQQYGFRVPPAPRSPSSASTPRPGSNSPSVPPAEQAAASKCGTITAGLRQRHPGRGAGRHHHPEQRHRQRRGARPGGKNATRAW